MTPLAVEMLVWFCTRAAGGISSFPNLDRAPQQEIIRWFHLEGVLDRSDAFAAPTAKAHAWMRMICETPMPIQQWIDPRTAPPPPNGDVRG